MFKPQLPRRMKMLSLCFLVTLTACGGGGTPSLNLVGSGGTGSISGFVTKGPVSGATVTAYSIVNGQMGAPIGTATSSSSGNFTMPISSYSGPVMIRVTGGTYTDEASGNPMVIGSNDPMTAVIPDVATGTTSTEIQVTPITAMAQSLAQGKTGGMTPANIQAANTALGLYFSVSDILHIQPMNPLTVNSGTTASSDAKNYGLSIAAMSQYALTNGVPNTSVMVSGLMSDASDGMMNGKSGNNQIPMTMGNMMGNMATSAGTSSMASAMTTFLNSAANKSGLSTADLSSLITRLSNASGAL